MLNFVWYVARFKLNMDVVCHFLDDTLHLYPSTDNTSTDTVELLDKKDVKPWLTKKNAVYLFDSGEDNGRPLYAPANEATSMIATSPYLKHYSNVCPTVSCTFTNDPNVVPLWYYAWSYEEIVDAFPLLRQVYTLDAAESLSAYVNGNFRYALQLANGDKTEDMARELKKKAFNAVSPLLMGKLDNEQEDLAEPLYDNCITRSNAPNYSHHIMSFLLSDEASRLTWSPQERLTAYEQDNRAHDAEEMKEDGDFLYFRECRLTWVTRSTQHEFVLKQNPMTFLMANFAGCFN